MTSLYTQDSSAHSPLSFSPHGFFYVRVCVCVCVCVPPLCLAHWWEGMEIIQDLVRYGLL